MIKDLVVYHRNCADGTCAAALFGANRGFDNLEFIAAQYGDDFLTTLKGKFTNRNVFIVDFSIPPAEMHALAFDAKNVIMFDHHETAYQKWNAPGVVVPPNVTLVFNNKRSGTGLVKAYLYPDKLPLDHPVNPFLNICDYVEDYDLYKFEMTMSKAVNAYLNTKKSHAPIQFYRETIDSTLSDLFVAGQLVISYRDCLFEEANKRVMCLVDVDGKTCGIVLNNYTQLKDALAEYIYTMRPELDYVAVVVPNILFDDPNVTISLRADKKRAPVRPIAEKFGGGGHNHSSGIKVPLAQFLEVQFDKY